MVDGGRAQWDYLAAQFHSWRHQGRSLVERCAKADHPGRLASACSATTDRGSKQDH